jgi:hypothetical protein
MSMASPNVRAHAGRLIAVEAARADPRVAPAGAAVRVCEKLRLPLSRLAGVAGFRSLLSRALAMAKAEVPSLGAMQVQADGSFARLDGEGQDQDAVLAGEGGVAVVAHLLDLLVTFIGEPLTLRLVRDAWPDEPVDETDREARGEP